MPITQSRMLRLIEAATELEKNHQNLLAEVLPFYGTADPEIQTALRELQAAGVSTNQPGIERLIAAHDIIIDTIKRHSASPAAISVISEERGHFNARRKINDRSRENIMRKRKSQTEGQEPEISSLDLEIPPEIDLNELHNKIWTFYKEISGPFHISQVAALIAEMGEHNLRRQLEIISILKSKNILLSGQFTGEVIPTEPAVGSKDSNSLRPGEEQTENDA